MITTASQAVALLAYDGREDSLERPHDPCCRRQRFDCLVHSAVWEEALEGKIHQCGECEQCREERDVLRGEMCGVDEGGMESFGAVDSRE